MTTRSLARYVTIQSAPPLMPYEVLSPERNAVFLTLRWGDSVLHAGEVDPQQGFHLAESLGALSGQVLPRELLEDAAVALIRFRDGKAVLQLPAQAQLRRTRGQLSESDAASREFELQLGTHVEIALGQFVFEIEHGPAGKRSQRKSLLPEPALLGFYALSFGVIGSLLGAMAYFIPPLGLSADDSSVDDQRYLMVQYLEASAERQQLADTSPQETAAGEPSEAASNAPDSPKPPAADGNDSQEPAPLAYALTKGSSTHEQTLQAAREFGMVGLVATLGTQPIAAGWSGPVLFDAETSGLWGDELGEFGGSGLRLNTHGTGAGGPGHGVDMGDIGGQRLGIPGANGPGGFVHLTRPGGPGHKTKVPSLTPVGESVVSGRLPATLIQRTVRQNFGRFRMCYEKGLTQNPNLTGRIEVRFLINSDGTVGQAMQGASDLPDAGVVSCIVRQFYALSFPKPDSGSVRVTYPLLLSPGE